MTINLHVEYTYSIMRLGPQGCDKPHMSRSKRRYWAVQRRHYVLETQGYLRYPCKGDGSTDWFPVTNERIANKVAKRYLKLNIDKFKEQVEA